MHKFVTSLSLVIGFTGGLSRNSWRHCTKTSLHVRLWTTHRTTRQVMAVPPFCSWAVWNYCLQGEWFFFFYYMSLVSITRLLPKKILEGPSELNAENLGAQHMKWKVLLWKVKAPRAILREPQATGLLSGNSLVWDIVLSLLYSTLEHWITVFILVGIINKDYNNLYYIPVFI